MAHKTFISYKYSDSRELRDKIIRAMGDDAKFYNGENQFSDDLSGESANKIKEYLKNMIWSTSVTIVIISPNVKKSKWVEWEIDYSLRNVTRADRISRPNGIVIVVANDGWNGTRWAYDYNWKLKPSVLFDKLNNLLHSRKAYMPFDYGFYGWETHGDNSYAITVDENTFLSNPNYYVNKAYIKAQHCNYYNL